MKNATFFILALSIYSCSFSILSLDDYTKGWIGRSIEEKKKIINREGSYADRIGWKETIYKLDNGNWVYVEPDQKNCFIHWEVNTEGIIVGNQTKGVGCE